MITTIVALRKIGVDAVSVCTKTNRFGYKVDYNFSQENCPNKWIRKSKKAFFFLKMLLYYDIIHYHCGHSFYGGSFFDMKIFSLFHKKIVVEFWGSDIRKPGLAVSKNPYFVNAANISDEDTIALQQKVSRYISHVIVSDYEMREYVDPSFKYIHVVPQRIDLGDYFPNYPKVQNHCPLIVHAPSLRGYKGTETILRVIDSLRSKFSFRFELIENLTHDDAIQRYSQADIVVDEIRTGAYGILAIEAMALGKPVVCYIRPDLEATYPKGMPIVSASPDSFEQTLIELLIDGPKRHQLGIDGRKYVEENHDSITIAQQLLQIYREI